MGEELLGRGLQPWNGGSSAGKVILTASCVCCLCCVTDNPKMQSLKTSHLLFLMGLCCTGDSSDLAWVADLCQALSIGWCGTTNRGLVPILVGEGGLPQHQATLRHLWVPCDSVHSDTAYLETASAPQVGAQSLHPSDAHRKPRLLPVLLITQLQIKGSSDPLQAGSQFQVHGFTFTLDGLALNQRFP